MATVFMEGVFAWLMVFPNLIVKLTKRIKLAKHAKHDRSAQFVMLCMIAFSSFDVKVFLQKIVGPTCLL